MADGTFKQGSASELPEREAKYKPGHKVDTQHMSYGRRGIEVADITSSLIQIEGVDDPQAAR